MNTLLTLTIASTAEMAVTGAIRPVIMPSVEIIKQEKPPA